MKKVIFTIIIFSITVASCDPAKWMDKYYSQMCIKNNTPDIIKISGTGDRYMLIGEATVFPGDSVAIWAIDKFRYLNELPAFDDFVGGGPFRPHSGRAGVPSSNRPASVMTQGMG